MEISKRKRKERKWKNITRKREWEEKERNIRKKYKEKICKQNKQKTKAQWKGMKW